MIEREMSLVEQISRAETDLLEFKNTQIFGKDVTKPKVIQRYNSDGTPTDWDVEGDFQSLYEGDFSWRIDGRVIYRARSQESPWAAIYAKLMVNPTNTLVPGGAGYYYSMSAYADVEKLFTEGKEITFNIYSIAVRQQQDATVDRLWVKFYVLATDEGEMILDFPAGQTPHGRIIPTK